MRVNTRNIREIKSVIDYLIKEFGLEDDELDEIKIGDEKIVIPFPRDQIEHSIDDFYKYIKEFKSIKIIEKTTIQTDNFTNKIVFSDSLPIEYLLEEYNFYYEFETGIKIDIIENPILVGLAATKLGYWDKYAPPCSSYCALEIQYPQGKRVSDLDEEKLIQSFLFEISNLTNISIRYSEFIDGDPSFMAEREHKEVRRVFESRKLEDFTPTMNYFIKACAAEDVEISFLYYYKILEYFSPIVARINAFDKMRKKLDSPYASKPDGEFLQSIFQLSKEYNKSLFDNELIKYSIRDCFDVIDLSKFLPESIRKRIRKQFQIKEMDYDIDQEKQIGISNFLGSVIYSTRNQIVHAKSNYVQDNYECPTQDLGQFNIFIKHACYASIKWYNRLPQHLK